MTPTQTQHPWRATVRTVIVAAIAILPLLPDIAHAAGVETVPAVASVLAIAAAVNRLLATPVADALLARWLPALAAAPKDPNDPPDSTAQLPSTPTR